MTSTSPPQSAQRRVRWPLAVLVLALAWVALVRIPLVKNAASHLDSDLAVDGLTLAEAVRGHWRWHYPGTPHMGTVPVALSWPQARIAGATPLALVSGGVVAYELVVLSTFVLAWRAFGPRVAAWALVPLAFASTGTVWLSGRLTGGHLLTLAWHAAAFWLLHVHLTRGGLLSAALLGLWCGLGLYIDQMFLFSLVFIATAAAAAGMTRSASVAGAVETAAAFGVAFLVGYAPHWLGQAYEPHDAYKEQFRTIFQAAGPAAGEHGIAWSAAGDLGWKHARIFLLEGVPRLVAGHLLPRGEAEPNPAVLEDRAGRRRAAHWSPIAAGAGVISLGLLPVAILTLAAGSGASGQPASDAVRWGVLGSSAAVAVAFVINLNIYNSDNYRYLVFLLIPWCLGFGLLMHRLAQRGWRGQAAAAAVSISLAALMTADTAVWYSRFGWIDGAGWPIRKPVRDPALAWLQAHPTVDGVFGGYWDVYRLSFLTGGRVRGVPYPTFPDRFPEWSATLPGHRPKILVVRPSAEGNYYRTTALQQGGRELLRTPLVSIYEWP